jgi:hypothetical protein
MLVGEHCRICLNQKEQDDMDLLKRPCRCADVSKHVHIECWLRSDCKCLCGMKNPSDRLDLLTCLNVQLNPLHHQAILLIQQRLFIYIQNKSIIKYLLLLSICTMLIDSLPVPILPKLMVILLLFRYFDAPVHVWNTYTLLRLRSKIIIFVYLLVFVKLIMYVAPIFTKFMLKAFFINLFVNLGALYAGAYILCGSHKFRNFLILSAASFYPHIPFQMLRVQLSS